MSAKKTTIAIEGQASFSLPTFFGSKEEVLNYFGDQYPEMANMEHSSETTADGNEITHTFKLVDGTKN